MHVYAPPLLRESQTKRRLPYSHLYQETEAAHLGVCPKAVLAPVVSVRARPRMSQSVAQCNWGEWQA